MLKPQSTETRLESSGMGVLWVIDFLILRVMGAPDGCGSCTVSVTATGLYTATDGAAWR
jgi:hypothetical protein